MNYLYGLTVQGIQNYIFATNNLREIIGGSEIVELVCSTWFDEFLKKNRIDKESDGFVIQQAAGNIKYFTSEDIAKKIFEGYANYINQKAPGLPFSTAVVEGLNFNQLDMAMSAQRNIPQHHLDLAPMSRFLARTTGDAAVEMKNVNNENYRKKRSSVDTSNLAKFNQAAKADDILRTKAGINHRLELVDDFEEMAIGGKHNWLALIHIDGNGMGQRIREISNDELKDTPQKVKAIQDFAKVVNDSTNEAFKKAYQKCFENFKGKIPLRPLIIGGDDVTLILRADFALDFSKTFLEEYKNQTGQQLEKELTACAGIAYIKAKFPFHYSAHLAEALCVACKKESGRDKAALLFHKVSDSFIADYEELVERELTLPDKATRLSKPYYDVSELVAFNDKLKLLKNEKGLKNAIRQWVDLSMNQSPEAELIVQRANKKYTDNFKGLETNQYADYLTLLAVS